MDKQKVKVIAAVVIIGAISGIAANLATWYLGDQIKAGLGVAR